VPGWAGAALAASTGLLGVLPIAAATAYAALYGNLPPVAVAGLCAGVVLAIHAFNRLRRDGPLAAWPATAVAVVPIYLSIYQGLFPNVADLWVSSRLTQAAATLAPCPEPELLSVGFAEASLAFLAGTDTRFVDAPAAVARLRDNACAIAFVEGRMLPEFRAALAGEPVLVQSVATVEGYNLGNGRRVRLEIFRPEGP